MNTCIYEVGISSSLLKKRLSSLTNIFHSVNKLDCQHMWRYTFFFSFLFSYRRTPTIFPLTIHIYSTAADVNISLVCPWTLWRKEHPLFIPLNPNFWFCSFHCLECKWCYNISGELVVYAYLYYMSDIVITNTQSHPCFKKCTSIKFISPGINFLLYFPPHSWSATERFSQGSTPWEHSPTENCNCSLFFFGELVL